ncbi:MAG: hypothetical protein M3P49_07560 [Actinomycetota bacterium]|nr:hypothetical protein [Actinomycetota bacterium]
MLARIARQGQAGTFGGLSLGTGVLLVALGAALWGTDGVLRTPLLREMSPAAIVLGRLAERTVQEDTPTEREGRETG